MRRLALALAATVILVGASVALRLRSEPPPTHPSASPSSASERARPAPSEPGLASPALDAGAASEAPPRALPAAPPTPPEPDGLEDGGKAGHPVGDFSWKYAHATEEQLRSARRIVQRDHERELTACIERSVRSGRFQEATLAGLDLEALLAELAAGGGQHALLTVPGHRPVRSSDDAEGATSVRWMRFERFDEHRLYELANELDWLRRAAP
ncbi:MAG: hypothetical protein FJ294_01600 [Planctomycetes bacterium]|nr:hypothetical protein [Planctomycetota bacterium]